jgi:iron-sulfur cluster assembly protein
MEVKMARIMTVTERALDFIKKSIDNEKCDGIRVDIVSGGCCGMTYKLDFVKDIDAGDLLQEEDGVKIYVAPRAVVFISGMTMVYVSNPLGGSIVFENPNARLQCGCGKSLCPDDSSGACGRCC